MRFDWQLLDKRYESTTFNKIPSISNLKTSRWFLYAPWATAHHFNKVPTFARQTQALSYYQRYMRAINYNDMEHTSASSSVQIRTYHQISLSLILSPCLAMVVCIAREMNNYILVLMKYFSDIYPI